MEKIIKSAIYGFVVGDALGVPVEFMKREHLKKEPVKDMLDNKSRRTTKGYWSDDTAMTLCTMQGIIESPKFDINTHECIMKKYLKWFEEGYMAIDNKCFGIGQTTWRILTKYRNSKSFSDYYVHNLENEKNGGNGAMMRILPIILHLYKNEIPKYVNQPKEKQIYRKYDFIEFNVGMTHQYRINIEACIFYTMFLYNLIDTKDLKQAYEMSVKQHTEWYASIETGALDRILLNKVYTLTEEQINSSGYVIDTLEASLWCLFNTNSYEEAVLKAINLGGDTDTIAAITGSMAGIYYGFETIPKKWLEQLREKELLDKTIKDFIHINK